MIVNNQLYRGEIKKYKPINAKTLNELVCDQCGLAASKDDVEFHEFISIYHRCGYGSIHEDGKQLQIDICQQCFADTFEDSLRFTERGGI